ncbi:MAG: AzlD domain-containing protein [Phascolarctobacterium faecium]
MSAEYVWGAIFIMMGVTYISRIIPFLLLAGKPVPRWFKTWLTYVPTAIFGALVLPDVFLPAGSLDLGLNNLYLWSTVIIFPLVYKKITGAGDSQRRRRLALPRRTLINRHSLQYREESALEIFYRSYHGLAILPHRRPKSFVINTALTAPLGIALVTAGIVASLTSAWRWPAFGASAL